MEDVKKLLNILKSKNCNYDECLEMIMKIGGPTQIIEDEYRLKTTPINEVVRYAHYDFTLSLINNYCVDYNVQTVDNCPLIWELQYLDSGKSEQELWSESENKLKLIRALIKAGATPNPICDGENLLGYIRFKLDEGEESRPTRYHLWNMEHIIEASVCGQTQRFFNKLKEKAVERIMLSKWGFWLIDDDLCDCDHAIFIFEDGEKMSLSSHQVDDDEWEFYAVSIGGDMMPSESRYRTVLPASEYIRYREQEYADPLSKWLDLSIDDAILRIHADDVNLMVGVVATNGVDFLKLKRQTLFI